MDVNDIISSALDELHTVTVFAIRNACKDEPYPIDRIKRIIKTYDKLCKSIELYSKFIALNS